MRRVSYSQCITHPLTNLVVNTDWNMKFLDRPAQSPDLNPVENLWATTKHNITPQKNAKGVGDLEKQLLDERWSVPQETINELIDTIPSRIQAVIDPHGGHTKYWWLLLSPIFFCAVLLFNIVFNIEVFWSRSLVTEFRRRETTTLTVGSSHVTAVAMAAPLIGTAWHWTISFATPKKGLLAPVSTPPPQPIFLFDE